MSLEKHEHKWTKLEDREKVTKLNKSTPRSKALKKKEFDGTGKVSVQGSKPMRMMLS